MAAELGQVDNSEERSQRILRRTPRPRPRDGPIAGRASGIAPAEGGAAAIAAMVGAPRLTTSVAIRRGVLVRDAPPIKMSRRARERSRVEGVACRCQIAWPAGNVET